MTPRPYLSLLQPLIENRDVHRAVVLMGPRRVGKTVLLMHVIQALIDNGTSADRIAYLSTDHPLYTGLDLEQLLDHCRAAAGIDAFEFVFLDEIQYVPQWEIQLKSLVDERTDVRFVVSGSAAAALRRQSMESGAGRFTDFLLPPLMFSEYMMLIGQQDLVRVDRDPRSYHCPDVERLNRCFVDYVNFGGYPEVALSPQIQRDPGRHIKNDIIDKVLLRDLPQLYGIQAITELNSLFTRLAFNTGQEISLEALSQESGIAKSTIRKYMEYLEAAFLIRRIDRIDQSAKHFKRAWSFKVHLTNPSMWAALFSPADADDEAFGRLAETAGFAQWFHEPRSLYFARWKQKEVDLVFLAPTQKPLGVHEFKWSDRAVDHPRSSLEGLLPFCRKHNIPTAWVTTRRVTTRKTLDDVALHFVPTALYCFAVGYELIEQQGVIPAEHLPI